MLPPSSGMKCVGWGFSFLILHASLHKNRFSKRFISQFTNPSAIPLYAGKYTINNLKACMFCAGITARGARGGAVDWVTALQAGRSRVSGICHWHNRSGRTMALGSTQPLTEMSTRGISWGGGGGGKATGVLGWQPYPRHVPFI
jgi:hypothetical protein